MVGLRVTFACALALLFVGVAPAAAAKQRPQKPNVVVIATDDQTLESLNPAVMPETVARLGERGTTFTQAITSTPQCCPSRAGFLTGQYAHNNGVIANRPGYPLLDGKKNLLPAWMQNAGYRTIHIGKYLNGYFEAGGLEPGPGWDRWLTLVRAHYTNPSFSIDGRQQFPGQHLTTWINEQATRMIDRYAPRRKPFYLQVDHLAPHAGAGDEGDRCPEGPVPAPQDYGLFAGALAPDNPATEETDLSDKPEFIRRKSVPTTDELEKADRLYGCALASLREVDRGIASILDALRRSGELGSTMVVFWSDNGYSYGEHRIQLAKGLPYEEHVRVPLLIKPPKDFPRRFRSGASLAAPVANIDLAATFLGLTRSDPCRDGDRKCRRMDGRSLLPLLKGRKPEWAGSRAIGTYFAINNPAYIRSCEWIGYRTPETSLTEHLQLPAPGGDRCRPASEHELYDLRDDPFQLQNLADPSGRQIKRLDRLARCSGIRGRDQRLRGRPYCE